MTPDELWEKYKIFLDVDGGGDIITYHSFLAALQEYGNFRAEQVRQQAVKLLDDNWYKTQSDCAAAIETMEIK